MEDHETLISAETLAEGLGDSGLVIVDCRFNLLEPDAGRLAYQDAHIPGAVYAHLDDDLAAPLTESSGRHPLPDVESLAGFFGASGIDATTQVVVYDDASGAIAARAWWLLRWLGHHRVAILDGGFAHWQQLDLPTEPGTTEATAREFVADPRAELVIDIAEALAAVNGTTDLQLVDARDAARFRGEREPIDAVAGHIPGAINFPCAINTGDDGTWKTQSELRALWSDTLTDAVTAPVGVMCGSGVTACHLVLSRVLAGLPEPRVYIGSWSEWIRDPSRPVATGAD